MGDLVNLPYFRLPHRRGQDESNTYLNHNVLVGGIQGVFCLLGKGANTLSESALQPAISLRHV
ncbi:hypothetical protein D3C80_1729480 [compost metagenome]